MTSSAQTAAIASRERAFSSKYSRSQQAQIEQRNAAIIAERAKVEANHLDELRAGNARAKAIWQMVSAGHSYEAAVELVDAA